MNGHLRPACHNVSRRVFSKVEKIDMGIVMTIFFGIKIITLTYVTEYLITVKCYMFHSSKQLKSRIRNQIRQICKS